MSEETPEKNTTSKKKAPRKKAAPKKVVEQIVETPFTEDIKSEEVVEKIFETPFTEDIKSEEVIETHVVELLNEVKTAHHTHSNSEGLVSKRLKDLRK